MLKQINKNDYIFNKYSFLGRWVSYYYQINEVLMLRPKSILEVGVGDKVFSSYVKNNSDIRYSSIDVAHDLNPDIIGSVHDIPIDDNSFDVVAAFEILEHLPFDKFENSLLEINRVSKKYAIISLPHFGPPIKMSFKIPFFKEFKISFKITYPKKHIFNGQHYWEIGKEGYSEKNIRETINKYFYIKKEFVPYENQYHHFYILEKK